MDRVGGGHQSVNVNPAISDKTQGTNKSEGDFRGFKVKPSKTFKSFLISLFSSKSKQPGTKIKERHIRAYKPTEQSGSNIKNPASDKNVKQPDKQAQHNPATIKRNFDTMCSNLERMQQYKNDLQKLDRGTKAFNLCSIELQLVKADYKASVQSFNNSVSADKQINASDLAMALVNKHSPEFAEDVAKFKQMNIPAFIEKAEVTQSQAEEVEQPIDLALKNEDTRKKFTDLCNSLKKMQDCKNKLQDTRQHSNNRIMTKFAFDSLKGDFETAVENFNSVVGNDLKIDAFDLEMAMANKDAPEYAESIAKFKQMKIPSF